MPAPEAYLNLSASVPTKALKILEEDTNMKMYYATCLLVALMISVQSGPIPKPDEQDDAFAEVTDLSSTFHNVHTMSLQDLMNFCFMSVCRPT